MTETQKKILQWDLKQARKNSEAKDPIIKAYWQGRLDALIAVDNTIEFTRKEK